MNPASKARRWFFAASVVGATLTVAVSLWWSYGGESAVALAATLVAWAVTGLLGFVSGLRGEHRQWNVSPLVSGVLTGVITLGATSGAVAIANFRTSVALTTPTSDPRKWPPLVRAAAQDSDNGRVLSVLCDKARPNPGDLGACAVTFEGPMCQYWLVGSVDGEDVVEAGDEINDGGAYHDAGDAICDWPVPEFPG